ncbi:MAG: CPBP family intramembrane metalloprotease [Oscillospiraceae bacterium]|nr:CPBP family intramembrane metalloprotease [Oscillospiraceae bacterium]
MSNYTVRSKVWLTVKPLVAFLIVGIISQFFGDIIRIVFEKIIEAFFSEKSSSIVYSRIVINTISDITFIILYVFYYISKIKEIRKTSPLYTHNNNKIVLGFLVSITSFGLMLLVSFTIRVTKLTELYEYEEYIKSYSFDYAFIHFVSTILNAPIVEELCFRGLMLNYLLSITKPKIAILIQAVLFGIIHIHFVQIIYSFVLGIVLGSLYLRFRNTGLCVIAHAAMNLPAFLVSSVPLIGNYEMTLTHILIIGVILSGVGGVFLINQPPAKIIYS